MRNSDNVSYISLVVKASMCRLLCVTKRLPLPSIVCIYVYCMCTSDWSRVVQSCVMMMNPGFESIYTLAPEK